MRDYFNMKNYEGQFYFNSADSFFLLPTVPLEVEKIIDDLNANKATGPMSKPVFILKCFKIFFPFGSPN